MRSTSAQRRFAANSNAKSNPVRRAANAAANHMEQLEDRQLRSATLSGSTLFISGTAGPDRIDVDQSGTSLYVFENSVLTKLLPTSAVGNIVISAGAGDDYVKVWNAVTPPDEIYGEDGNDTIFGGVTGEYIQGGNGNDYINSGSGNDAVWAGEGNDIVYAMDGADMIGGAGGADSLSAGAGNDTVWGEAGNDTCYGESGNDRIYGGDNDDFVGCSTGNDTVYGGWGNDRIYGEAGNDYLAGEDGNDYITGGANNDTMLGGNGNDTFYAEDNYDDYLDGGAGWDNAQVDIDHWWEFDSNDTRWNIEYAFES
jgi:Ca2+-binding RTX toxin-like protein